MNDLINNIGTPSLAISGDSLKSITDVVSGLIRLCAGFTINGGHYKRERMISNNEVEI